ncbi:MAG: NrfD/PsrC family molybdoenzyme membrane anchor subunit [Candidatus Korobacteraceae bacterium]|jgi:formate-dependent nitrite reductase membrane component NrfD
MSPRLQAEWGARVSLDFFFGGAGAGLLGSYLLIAARNGYRGLSVAVIATGVALVLLGLLLLASELGRPANALRSMENPGTSWMARGAIFNLALIAAALLLITVLLAGSRLLVPTVAMLTLLCSGLVAAYPGFLLFGAKDIRLWHSRLLPGLMFLYSLMSGLSLLTLADSALHLGMQATLRPAALIVMLPVTILFVAFWGKSWRRLVEQQLLAPFVVSTIAAGILLPLVCYVYAAFSGVAELPMLLGAVSFLAGAVCLRYFVVKAASHEPVTFLAKRS